MRYIVLAILLLSANRFLPVVTLAEEPQPVQESVLMEPAHLSTIDAPVVASIDPLALDIAAFQAPPRMLGSDAPVLSGPDALPALFTQLHALLPTRPRPEAIDPVAETQAEPSQDPAVAVARAETEAPVTAVSTDMPLMEAEAEMSPDADAVDAVIALFTDAADDEMAERVPEVAAQEVVAIVETSDAMVADIAAAESTDPSPVVADTSDMREVTASTLNVRSGPSSRTPVVATLKGGDLLTVTGERKGGWVKVATDDRQQLGWVFSRYLEPLGDA